MAKTAVFWDIGTCPIPDGYDPRLVGPAIVSALRRLGVSGPITITGIGNLNPFSTDVLESLSCTGIALRNVGKGLFGLVAYSYTWIHFNPSPANLMFISSLKLSPSVGIETVLSQSLCQLVLQRYSIFWAYPSIPEPTGISVAASGNWLWESLLEATDAAVANTLQVLLHQDEIYSPWFCSLCFVPCHSFDDFIMHFKSDNHLLRLSSILGPTVEEASAESHPKNAISSSVVKKQPKRRKGKNKART